MTPRLVPACALAAVLACACASHDAIPMGAEAAAAQLAAVPGGRFDLPRALAHALAHNPRIQALEAEVRALAEAVPGLDLEVEVRGGEETLAPMVDPVAWLGLGQRGATLATVDARHRAAFSQLAQARWEVAREVVTAYAVESALEGIAPVVIPVEAAPFAASGLASPVAVARLEAAQQGSRAEAMGIVAMRESNLVALGAQLGLGAEVEFEVDAPAVFPFARAEVEMLDEALLRRPDVLVAAAVLEQADAEFREAVAAQYPSLRVGPEFGWSDGSMWNAMGYLVLPVFADGPARAARELRAARAAELRGAIASARADAVDAMLANDVDEARLVAARAAAAASAAALAAAIAAVATEPDAFDPLSEAAAMAVRDAGEYRMAALEAARSRVRAAFAAGWPRKEIAQ